MSVAKQGRPTSVSFIPNAALRHNRRLVLRPLAEYAPLVLPCQRDLHRLAVLGLLEVQRGGRAAGPFMLCPKRSGWRSERVSTCSV